VSIVIIGARPAVLVKAGLVPCSLKEGIYRDFVRKVLLGKI
jgi:hypothetical protein